MANNRQRRREEERKREREREYSWLALIDFNKFNLALI